MKHATTEELEAENQKLLEELENTPESIPSQPTSEVIPETETLNESLPEENVILSEPTPESEPEAIPSPDYKKKFSEEAKQNQKIYAKNRKLNQAIDEANEIIEPTEEELQAEYADWDLLDETTKKIAKESFISNKRFALISEARVEGKKIEKWDEDVNKFIDDPQTFIDHPELEGKADDFKVFANQESNNSIPFKVLVNSFLYEQSKIAKPKSKGAMFPDGSGGPNDNPKPKGDITSIEEMEHLRNTNWKKYREILASGKYEKTV